MISRTTESARGGARRGAGDDDVDEEDDYFLPRRMARAPVRDDDDDDDEPMDDETRRKLERQLKKKALKLVDIGLLLHYIKLVIYVIGMLLGLAVVILLMVAFAQTTQAVADQGGKGQVEAVQPGGGFIIFGFTILAVLIFLLQLFMSLIASLLGIVGSFLLCWVPKKSEARGTIITSLTFDLIHAIAWLLGVLAVAGVFGMDPTKTQNMIFLLDCINAICVISSWLTFLTFLRSLGKYLGEPGVGNEALNLIARLVVQVVSLILDIIFIIVFAIMFGGIVAIIAGSGALLVWSVFFTFTFYLRQLKLLGAMRRAVQNKI